VAQRAVSAASLSPRIDDCALRITPAEEPLMDSMGRRLRVGQPIVAEVRTGTLILGWPVVAWPPVATDVPDRQVGVVLNLNGGVDTVVKPPGVARVQNPRLLSYANGTAHIVWGTARDTSISGLTKMDVIWYGAFDGRQWSAPEEVLRGYTFLWDIFAPAALAVGDRFYVATTSPDKTDSIGTRQLWIARRVAGQWEKQSPVSERGFLNLGQFRLVGTDPTGVVLVYSGFKDNGITLRPYVNVVRSIDAGATWSPPATIRMAPEGTTAMLGGLHRRRDGTLHLLWHAQRDGTINSSAVFHDVSSDDGRTWEQRDSLVIPEQFSALRTSQVGDAIVMTILRADDSLVQALVTPRATIYAWSAESSPSIPASVVRANGTIEAWWSEYSDVALRDKSTYGLTRKSLRTTTTIDCQLGKAGTARRK